MGQRKWIYMKKKKNCIASTSKAIIYWEKIFHFKNQGAPKSLNFPPLSLQLITKLRLLFWKELNNLCIDSKTACI